MKIIYQINFKFKVGVGDLELSYYNFPNITISCRNLKRKKWLGHTSGSGPSTGTYMVPNMFASGH